MIVVQEVTEWDADIQNHIYFLSDDKSKMYGYVRRGTNKPFTFSKPLGFVASRRKFKPIENTWGFTVEKPTNPSWEVQGSKGNVYTVEKTQTGFTCTCSGFKFRGHCKHIDQIRG